MKCSVKGNKSWTSSVRNTSCKPYEKDWSFFKDYNTHLRGIIPKEMCGNLAFMAEITDILVICVKFKCIYSYMKVMNSLQAEMDWERQTKPFSGYSWTFWNSSTDHRRNLETITGGERVDEEEDKDRNWGKRYKVKASLCFFNWAPRHEGEWGEWR